MLSLPVEFANLLAAFGPLFSQPVFQHVQVLVVGAILATGKRTVTAVLRVMGLSQEKHFQNYHRVLNRAVWSNLGASRILLTLLFAAFAPTGVLVMGLDDTIERRRGERIHARGIYRDPVRSSHSHFVKASGLRWLSLMRLVPIPWASNVWALPFLTALCPSERYHTERGRRHQTLTARARQMLLVVKRWLPERQIVVVADGSFAALDLLDAVRQAVTVVTRLRLDAALYEPAPVRQGRPLGRPRKKGKRLPTLDRVLKHPQTVWPTIEVKDWYGRGPRTLQVSTGTAVWYHSGLPTVPLRWVLVRDPDGKLEPQAFLCTDVDADPTQILEWFVQRWQVEVTFEEAREHLGVETQRQWNDRSIARTTPVLLGLYSLITLMANRMIPDQQIFIRTAAWYVKDRATFSDTIALVRRCLWSHLHFPMSDSQSDMVKMPRELLTRFTDLLCYAA